MIVLLDWSGCPFSQVNLLFFRFTRVSDECFLVSRIFCYFFYRDGPELNEPRREWASRGGRSAVKAVHDRVVLDGIRDSLLWAGGACSRGNLPSGHRKPVLDQRHVDGECVFWIR